MPDRRRTRRPLLTSLVAGALLVAGTTSSAAAPSRTDATTSTTATSTTTASTATTPSPSPAPGVDDGEPDGLPWPGIVVGGGLGLVAGTVLMVLSKRREDRD